MGSECCTGRTSEVAADPATGRQQHNRENSSAPVPQRDASSRNAINHNAVIGDVDDETLLREQIRLTARNVTLEVRIPPKEVDADWLSPLTCEGAAIAVNLAGLIDSHSKNVGFRAFVKSVAIQETLIPKLLQNFKSANQSLRLSSAHLLSFLITKSQFELVRIFVAADGLKRLKLLVASENCDGLTATVAKIVMTVYTASEEYESMVQQTEVTGVLLEKLKTMRKVKYILETLERLRELPTDSNFGECLEEVTRASSRGELQAENTPEFATLRATVATLQQRVSLSH